MIHFVHRHFCFMHHLEASPLLANFLHSETYIWRNCATAVNLILKYTAASKVIPGAVYNEASESLHVRFSFALSVQ